MSKKIAILGSTGSIGTNALRVIEALGPEYKVVAISGHNNVQLLHQQQQRFRPDYIVVTNPDSYSLLKEIITDRHTRILCGPEGLEAIATLPEVDIVITAIVGAAGLGATLAAAQEGKTLAIANKEPLVVAGKLLTETVKKNNATIIPVDSEHSAIFQCLRAGRAEEAERIILTASGGPFRGATAEQIKQVSIEDALAHPTWNMGPKITVDSATMMNKALEIIEARWLFDVCADMIEVLVHPESIIHSMVEFVDGTIIAQMGPTDMCLPIQYALTYPRRLPGIGERLRLEQMGQLTFEKPDFEVFRSLQLGFDVARMGGSAAAVFNAANEAAVGEFLSGRIKFSRIVELIERCLGQHRQNPDAGLEELLQADTWARKQVLEYLDSKTSGNLC